MYRIIGADGNEYGPVTSEQVRQWITEGRANGQTNVRVEGSPDWQMLGRLPEFTGDLRSAPPPINVAMPKPAPPALVSSKASIKIAAGICGILLGWLGVHKFILGYTGAGLIMLLVTILTCGIGSWVTGVIGLIEGIIYLTKPDEDFVRTYVDGHKEWF
jgi:TM2 domain-containing membrane protein YozV